MKSSTVPPLQSGQCVNSGTPVLGDRTPYAPTRSADPSTDMTSETCVAVLGTASGTGRIDEYGTAYEMVPRDGKQPANVVQSVVEPNGIVLHVLPRAQSRVSTQRSMQRPSSQLPLRQSAPVEQLADVVRRVHAGQRVVDPALAVAAWDEQDPLTDREREVLRLAARGHPNGDIAAQLHLAEGTVRNYLSTAMTKVGARNRAEAAHLAQERGWL